MRTLLIALLLVCAAAPALAGDTTLSSGILYYSNTPGDVDTYCIIYNAGTKPVTITSVGLLPGPNEGNGTATLGGSCVTQPLAPDHSCLFGGTRATISQYSCCLIEGGLNPL